VTVFSLNSAQADHPTIAFGSESSGPINTIPATLLPKGAASVGIRTEVIDFDRFSDSRLEDFASTGEEGVHSVDRLVTTSVSFAYGMTDDLSVSVRLPHVKRKNIREGELEGGVPEAHEHGDADSIGDLVVLGQYRFLNTHSVDVSLLGGIKVPTGKTTLKDDGARLETEFQPGSGSWDGLLGLAASIEMERVGVHGNVLYSLNSEGDQDTEIGDAFFYNLGLTFNLTDAIHQGSHQHSHRHLKWDAMLELNGELRDKNEVDDSKEDNTGGNLLYLSPGLRLSSSEGWGAFLSVGFPVHDDLNGIQTDVDYRVVAGFGFAFD
jgi:hypothetical protein